MNENFHLLYNQIPKTLKNKPKDFWIKIKISSERI